jgi:CRP-like cAMP-binding protein
LVRGLPRNEVLVAFTGNEAGTCAEEAIMILPEEMANVGFLQDLGEPYLSQIAAIARLKECGKGTILFSEGEASPVIYFILSGEVRLVTRLVDEEPFTIYTAGPGEMIGWSSLLGRNAMTATACVSSRCRLAVLDAKRTLLLCEQDPHFGLAFLQQVIVFLSDRLASTRRCLAISRALVPHTSPFALAHEGSD